MKIVTKANKNLSIKKTQKKKQTKMKLQTKFDLINYNVNRNLSKNVFVKRQKKR